MEILCMVYLPYIDGLLQGCRSTKRKLKSAFTANACNLRWFVERKAISWISTAIISFEPLRKDLSDIQTTTSDIEELAFLNVVCKVSVIWSRSQRLKCLQYRNRSESFKLDDKWSVSGAWHRHSLIAHMAQLYFWPIPNHSMAFLTGI